MGEEINDSWMGPKLQSDPDLVDGRDEETGKIVSRGREES
jgi:hypothetical protein